MIIFTTMFKDLGRDKWQNVHNSQGRGIQSYISYFKHLAENIEYPLVVYVETHVLKEIINSVKLKSNIILIDSSTVRTFLDTHLESETTIMNSEAYKKLLPEGRRTLAEHCIPGYTLVTHSKLQFVSTTKKMFPGYQYYAWIDFGWVRYEQIETIPKNIDFNKLGQKIIMNNLEPIPKERIPADRMVARYDIFFGGGTYIMPTHLVEVTQHLYDKKMEEWQRIGIADDEQNLFYQLWWENKDLFTLITTGSNNWWALYRDHLNKKWFLDQI